MVKLRTVILLIVIVLIVAAGAITFGLVPGITWNSLTHPSSSPAGQSGEAVSPTMVQGADPLVGSWQGSKSLMFGVATADYTLVARQDGTMTISGTVDAPMVGVEKLPFSTEATWERLSGTTYVGTISGKSMKFTCDGSKIAFTVNPYEAGLVDYEILNIDIDLTLTRR